MINVVMNILKMLVPIIPFVFLCLQAKRVNLDKTERTKQFFMPIIAVVYSFVAMMLLDSINSGVMKAIKGLPALLGSLASLLSTIGKLASGLKGLSSLLSGVLESLNLTFWVAFITNILIILVYLTVKKICLSFISKYVNIGDELHTKISGVFYEFFVERGSWCIREKFVQTRKLFQVFYYGSIVLSVALMILSRYLYFAKLLKSVFYPVFGIIIVGELFFYLDSSTRREYSSILGEDEDAYKVVNYSVMRKFLRVIFGDKILTENTSRNNALAYDVTNEEVIRELEDSEDMKIQTFATYMNALLKTSDFTLDHNYLHSAVDLLNGKSVLFNNPFYNDLIPYAIYPLNRTLMRHRKVLVVLGRHAIEDDIKEWLQEGIERITNVPFMWQIDVLGKEEKNTDIGIISYSDVLDIDVHNANAKFLENVEYCVIIEPSKLVSTAQIGLSLLVKKIKYLDEKNVTFCLCDKNCDGLVDTMSHLLMTSLSEVSATNKHSGTSSHMCWDADNDCWHHRLVPNISRYLGIGTELSFAALKNQVSNTYWYGGEAFPVSDMNWIDKQYYFDLMNYAGLPTGQEIMDNHFHTSPNFWSAKIAKNNYFTVEDESFNMFEILRAFSTRSKEQGFINVISSDYLLKDYMAANASIFQTDAKAIPYIVSDFVRTNRNTILKLVLMMSSQEVSEKMLVKEFSLIGLKICDVKKQIWYELYKCYADLSEISTLPDDYEKALNEAYTRKIKIGKDNPIEFSSDVIVQREKYNFDLYESETVYLIESTQFIKKCVAEFKSAAYIAEDEKGDKYYLGAELRGQIYQKYIPGQFFTFGGKYYQMQYLTADGQALVRRAADHINGRPTYRQIRKYEITGTKPVEKIGAHRNISGMKISREFADVCVKTDGYYNMRKYNDFNTAQKVMFEGKNSGIPERVYRSKEILRIELPSLDGAYTDSVRYTITTLINEVFRTLFAENQAYICAVTDDSHLGASTNCKTMTYSVEGVGCTLSNNSIYIIEDSQLDLGLMEAVERNLNRILKIVQDYLEWHYEALGLSLDPPKKPEPPKYTGDTEKPEDEEAKKKGIKGVISKIVDKIKGKKKKPSPTDDTTPADDNTTPVDDDKTTPVDDDNTTPADNEQNDTIDNDTNENGYLPDELKPNGKLSDWFKKKRKGKDKDKGKDQDADKDVDNDKDKDVDKNKEEPKEFEFKRAPYHSRYYLLYGQQSEPDSIDAKATLNYLTLFVNGEENPLKKARKSRTLAQKIETERLKNAKHIRRCDFCGREIYGVEYEVLADGRERCIHCSRTAVKTEEEFLRIFEDVKRNMEAFYSIRLNVGVRVEMVNSRKLHKALGQSFVPTSDFDGRVLGVAIKSRDGYRLLVENGAPRMASIMTIAHELTHIWQYVNWDAKAIKKKYGDYELQIYEGMAKWAEIQYAYLLNEPVTARREEILTAMRNDEYGHGFLRYRANYPLSRGTVLVGDTPFMDPENPLDLEFCGELLIPGAIDGFVDGEDPEDNTDYTDDNDNNGGGNNGGSDGNNGSGDDSLQGERNRNPEDVNLYCYDQLSVDEQLCYASMHDAIMNFKKDVSPLPAKINGEQLRKIMISINHDHSYLDWCRRGWTYNQDSEGNITEVHLAFCLTPEQVDERQKKVDAAVAPFLATIKSNMSDYEVVLRAYEYIISLVDYDSIGLDIQDNDKDADNKVDDLRSVYGVFVNKKTVCAGYSRAMQYLLNLLGIECAYITGYAGEYHAWNLVKLEGEYYYIDTTWGDGSNTKVENNYSAEIGYDYFCITTKELLRDHKPDDNILVPECTAIKCNYHYRNGLYLEKYDFEKIRDKVCQYIDEGKTSISFRCSDMELAQSIFKKLVNEGKMGEIIQYSNLKSRVRVSGSYDYYNVTRVPTLKFRFTKV